jgi:threonine aldolase
MEINLISDTVKPTNEMLQYMFNAEVGDDVYRQTQQLYWKQEQPRRYGSRSVFPSGIMANQTAIKVNTQPGEH